VDYQTLWAEIKARFGLPKHIVYSIDNPDGVPNLIRSSLAQQEPLSFARVLHNPEGRAEPEQECLAGLFRTVCAEHNDARCVLMEVDNTAIKPENLYRILVRELAEKGASHLRN